MKINDIENEFKIAYNIAKSAHANQTDKAGVPYINHIDAVIAGVKTQKEKSVAALHDVIEDNSEWDAKRLLMNGISQEVVDAVIAMTKLPGEKYDKYLHRVKNNSLATLVKLSDLSHNSDLSRLPVISNYALKRNKKYKEAINFLTK